MGKELFKREKGLHGTPDSPAYQSTPRFWASVLIFKDEAWGGGVENLRVGCCRDLFVRVCEVLPGATTACLLWHLPDAKGR